MPEFPWVEHERVRFRDCDAMGHVNNAVYSTYLEQARIGILGGLEPFILARVEIDFRSELHAGEQVEVKSRCADVGTKSFRLAHQIWPATASSQKPSACWWVTTTLATNPSRSPTT